MEETDFNYLKEQTGATSGNISVQIDKLAETEKHTRTVCRIKNSNRYPPCFL